MQRIPLTQGKFAIVDADVYEYLSQFNWRAHKDRNTYYARRNAEKHGTTILMHREIMALYGNKQPEMEIDHRDHNGLNNTRANLSYVTRRQNAENRINNTSGYPGVSYIKRTRRYKAYVNIGNKQYHLGCFLLPQDAYAARMQFLTERGMAS